MEDKLLTHLEDQAEELIELTSQLIALPTPHPPGDSYEPLARFAADWLAEAGLDVSVVGPSLDQLPDLLPPEALGKRFLVFAELPGQTEQPTLCFNGHYDTVPPSQDWTLDPYQPHHQGDRLYGLGSTDMKGGLAAMMMAAKALAQVGPSLTGRLVFLASPDEELHTAAGLEYAFAHDLVRADYAIVGEPSGAHNLYIGMKGGLWGDIVVTGQAAHGSRPDQGINAFEKLVGLAWALDHRFKPRLKERQSRYDFEPPEANTPTLMLGGFVRGTNASRASVPDRCAVSFDRRIIPEESIDEVEQELLAFVEQMQTEDPQLQVTIKVSSRTAPMVISPDTILCQTVAGAVATATGNAPTLTVCTGGFETSLFVAAGIQAITYGPGVANCAHTADEYTLVPQLLTAAKVYALTALGLLA